MVLVICSYYQQGYNLAITDSPGQCRTYSSVGKSFVFCRFVALPIKIINVSYHLSALFLQAVQSPEVEHERVFDPSL